MRRTFRIISLIMLIAAVIFVACALSAPDLGRVIYIGHFRFGAEQWRVCYAVYVIAMAALFAASFFVKKGRQEDLTPSEKEERR